MTSSVHVLHVFSWGRFILRSRMTKGKIVSEYSDFASMFFNSANVVAKVELVSQDHILMIYRPSEKFEVKPASGTALLVGVYTTAIARETLHAALEKVGAESALYVGMLFMLVLGDHHHGIQIPTPLCTADIEPSHCTLTSK